MPHDPTQTTVYPSNARRSTVARAGVIGWDRRIARLVARDFAFLPLRYAGAGYLFRGLDSGLASALAQGEFGGNQGTHSLACLERDLDVLLVSQDFSDALAVSRLWSGDPDGAILVIPAALFAAEHAAGRAAVLSFADPGVVFRYPFLLGPLALADIAAVIVHPSAKARVELAAHQGARLLLPDVAADTSRAAFEQACLAALEQGDYAGAIAEPATQVPRLA